GKVFEHEAELGEPFPAQKASSAADALHEHSWPRSLLGEFRWSQPIPARSAAGVEHSARYQDIHVVSPSLASGRAARGWQLRRKIIRLRESHWAYLESKAPEEETLLSLWACSSDCQISLRNLS